MRRQIPVTRIQLRKIAGLTQQEIAERTGLTQSAVSRYERTGLEMHMLDDYVTALGGVLDLVVRLNGEEYTLVDGPDLDPRFARSSRIKE
jgi:transcriptional regulator with XRE-family HTH domain